MSQPEQNDLFEKDIKEIEESTKKIEEAVKKEAEENEENINFGLKLYNGIMNTVIEILRSESIVNRFTEITKAFDGKPDFGEFGDKILKPFIEIISLCMSQSAYQAIIFYDEMLKDELDKSFKIVGDGLNTHNAELAAHQGALEVFKQRLGEVEKTLKLNEISKENNVSVTKDE